MANFLAPTFRFGHHICLDLYANNLTYKKYYQVLACGESAFKNSHELDGDFTANARLFSTSGLQFFFFERLLAVFFGNRNKFSQGLYFFLSCLFTFIWGPNPAVLRAWLALLQKKTAYAERLNWPSALNSFLVGVLCLLIHPDWAQNLGFQICWLAALIMQLTRYPFWLRLTAVPIALWPLTWQLDTDNFLNSLALSILKPLVVAVLFPLSLLVAVIPRLGPFGDHAWQIALRILHGLDQSIGPLADLGPSRSPFLSYAIFYVILLHAIAFINDRFQRAQLYWAPERYLELKDRM